MLLSSSMLSLAVIGSEQVWMTASMRVALWAAASDSSAAPLSISWPLLIISAIGILVFTFGLGYVLGKRTSKQVRHAVPSDTAAELQRAIEPAERQRMLELLREIGTWSNEYSGQLSEYQNELGELSRSVQQNSGSDPKIGDTSERITMLLQQFMQNSGQLQQRLDAAEFQLEQKTRQIECYLNEARTDSLTGLFNRRAFDQRLEELFRNYRRGGRSFVVALIDIDHFKMVNDTHGHQTGDAALQAISNLLKQCLSETLMVSRFGGEEFAVIMDGPLLSAARQLDTIRRSLCQRGLELEKMKLTTSMSVGLSEPMDDASASSVVRRADEALYAAKNFGRNRVYYHDGREPTLVGSPETARNL
ncbi:diguanylate cyclase [Stieleria marina]|uniref:diguanylate cyclase n=1 Tax=Stieleria marina TaxID=1930275 RepID=A0A517P3H5_9BACT|nr:putative diguanylate cyclase AdrA [Planctomycetes bacterium K23_9]